MAFSASGKKKSKRTLYSQYKNAQVKNIHDDGGVMYSNILTIFDMDLRFILIFFTQTNL